LTAWPSLLLRRFIALTFATPLPIVNRERALARLIGPQPVPRDFAAAGSGYIKT
jgi:hypothetical protein